MESAWPQQPLPQPEPQQPRKRRGLGGIAVGAAAVAAKFKAVLLLLPKLKVLTTSASMLVSIVAYQLIFGWPFAVGFVLLLLVHEMGHVIQLRREGIQASAPIFIPFLGAVIAAKSLGEDAAAEARVGLAGPVLGTAATLVPLAIWLATGEDFWRALAYIGFFLNLFNLLPVLPLDGGRAMAVLGPKIWIVGILVAVAATVIFLGPFMLLLVLVIGGPELYYRWKNRHSEESRKFHSVPAKTKLAVAAVYFSLVVLLSIGVAETYVPRNL